MPFGRGATAPPTGRARPSAFATSTCTTAPAWAPIQSLGLSATYGNILMFLYTWFDTSFLRWFRPLRPLLRIPAAIAAKLFGAATLFAMIIEDVGDAQNQIVPDPEAPGRIRVSYRISDDLRRRIILARQLFRSRFSKFRMMNLHRELMINFGHPSGTCRFGTDAATSVLNPDCRTHEIDNLYVVDGSFMPSSGGTNPGLTIAANALRVGDTIAQTLEPRDGTVARLRHRDSFHRERNDASQRP